MSSASPHFHPPCPAPAAGPASAWARWCRHPASAHASWLALLQARSYRMKVGEAHLPGQDVFIVADPVLARDVLAAEHATVFARPARVLALMRALAGDGTLAAEGAAWRARRREDEARCVRFEAGAEASANDAMEALTERWRESPVLDIEPGVRETCVWAMARSMGIAVGDRGTRLQPGTAMAAELANGGTRLKPGTPSGLDVVALRAALHRFDAAASGLAGPSLGALWPGRLWHEARARLAGAAARAIVIRALDAREVDAAATALWAAHEPLATTLSWCLNALAHAPDVQARVREESRASIPSGAFAEAVVRETLRVYPPFPFLPRACRQVTSLHGKSLDEGDLVVVSPWLVQRHAAWWPHADAFAPARWTSAAASTRAAWLPFGCGPRACPAQGFSIAWLAAALAALVRDLVFEPGPGAAAWPCGRLALRPSAGVVLRISRA